MIQFMHEDKADVTERPGFKAIAYPLPTEKANVGKIRLTKSYPEHGWAQNENAEMFCYVLDGTVALRFKGDPSCEVT